MDALLIVISFFAGAAVTLGAMHAFGIRLMRVARTLNAARQQGRPPVFEVSLELDKDRVVEVGYAQAVREEAQRRGRLN